MKVTRRQLQEVINKFLNEQEATPAMKAAWDASEVPLPSVGDPGAEASFGDEDDEEIAAQAGILPALDSEDIASLSDPGLPSEIEASLAAADPAAALAAPLAGAKETEAGRPEWEALKAGEREPGIEFGADVDITKQRTHVGDALSLSKDDISDLQSMVPGLSGRYGEFYVHKDYVSTDGTIDYGEIANPGSPYTYAKLGGKRVKIVTAPNADQVGLEFEWPAGTPGGP